MIAPDNPLSKGPLPGLRNAPVVIKGNPQAFDIKKEAKITEQWLGKFYEGLSSI